jgi:hypothetical protein
MVPSCTPVSPAHLPSCSSTSKGGHAGTSKGGFSLAPNQNPHPYPHPGLESSIAYILCRAPSAAYILYISSNSCLDFGNAASPRVIHDLLEPHLPPPASGLPAQDPVAHTAPGPVCQHPLLSLLLVTHTMNASGTTSLQPNPFVALTKRWDLRVPAPCIT